jgi:hypothetical protein
VFPKKHEVTSILKVEQHISPERLYPLTSLHGITALKTTVWALSSEKMMKIYPKSSDYGAWCSNTLTRIELLWARMSCILVKDNVSG